MLGMRIREWKKSASKRSRFVVGERQYPIRVISSLYQKGSTQQLSISSSQYQRKHITLYLTRYDIRKESRKG